jgi:hypothetical protein
VCAAVLPSGGGGVDGGRAHRSAPRFVVPQLPGFRV